MTCFGYLGYKNALFGTHKAVTAYGRDKLLTGKRAVKLMASRCSIASPTSMGKEGGNFIPAFKGGLVQ